MPHPVIAMGIKKSNFISNKNIPELATFDFVANGQNFKIPKRSLLSELGVTGTIEQAGGVDTTPILDIDGNNYKIRNLEAGSGVELSITPQNGLRIAFDASMIIGGFNKPLVVSQPAYTALDGDVLIFDQNCVCTFPSSSASTVGIQIKARTGVTVTLTPNGTDTIEVTTLTSGQSVLHAPADDTPNNVWEKL